MPKTIATLFTGYDLFGMGAEQAGYVNVFGLDIHEPAVKFCHENNNTSVVCGDVRSHDYRKIKTDLFHFSPECKSFSGANTEGSETEQDREFARAIVRAIAESNPMYVSLENVMSYASSGSFEIVLSHLDQDYYYWVSNYCAADFGVPQTRDRLILRAIRKDQNRLLPKFIPPTHSKYPEDGLLPWVSWYDAIAGSDIIPALKPNKLADWQKRSLDEQGFDITGQTVLISKDGSRKRQGYEHTFALVIPKDSPVPTIKAMGHDRHCQQYAIVIDGNVFRVSTEAIARWQTVPDHCVFSGVGYIDCEGIGNGVPSLFAQRIVESFR